VAQLEKQVAEARRTKELAKRKGELLRELEAAEADSKATPVQTRALIAKDHVTTLALVPPRSSVLDAPEPEPMPAANDEAKTAAKVQTIWRGKARQNQATGQKETVLAGTERVLAAKRTIRNSQTAVMLLIMLTTAVGTLLPNFTLGGIFGAVADGEGIDRVLALDFGFRFRIWTGCSV
jgi:hypothetical protein